MLYIAQGLLFKRADFTDGSGERKSKPIAIATTGTWRREEGGKKLILIDNLHSVKKKRKTDSIQTLV